jgi:hypothetical protein
VSRVRLRDNLTGNGVTCTARIIEKVKNGSELAFSDLPYLRAVHGQAVFFFLTGLISAKNSEMRKCLSELKKTLNLCCPGIVRKNSSKFSRNRLRENMRNAISANDL